MERRKKKRKKREEWGKMIKLINWSKLFPKEVKGNEILAKLLSRVKRDTVNQEKEQKIGRLREQKVRRALRTLKEQGKIYDYFCSEKLSYTDLVEGVDFAFAINGQHNKVYYFSVTGKDWIEKHLEKHPEVPVLTIGLKEKEKSIREKIINLKDNSNCPHQ